MPVLSSSERAQLLKFCREAIEARLEEVSWQPPALNGNLRLCRGCFVTLRKGGALRGCIGTFETREPIGTGVPAMAVAAAFRDPRFPALSSLELDQLTIEISILGDLQKMESADQLEIGRHGVMVRLGERSGTYLPDVAVEQKWNAPRFIQNCAEEKAGISKEELSRAEVLLYEVEKFSS